MKIQEVLVERELQEGGKIRTTLGAVALALGLGTADLANAGQTIIVPVYKDQVEQAIKAGMVPGNGRVYSAARIEAGMVTAIAVDDKVYNIKDKLRPHFDRMIAVRDQIRNKMTSNSEHSPEPIIVHNLYPEDIKVV